MTRDVLLAIGAGLFMAGVIGRGLARSHRRALAARKLNDLEAAGAGTPAEKLSHLEKYGNRYATTLAILGGVIVAASFLR